NKFMTTYLSKFQKRLENLDSDAGIWIPKNNRNEASTKIAKTLSALYNDFIQEKGGYLWLMHEYILYNNQKYPNDADKIVNLLHWAYKHHPKKLFRNLETQAGVIKEYEKSFNRVMNPLKKRHENILTLLVRIARCPQNITNKTRIAIDELLTKPIVISSIDGTDKLSIDLAREKDISKEEMQRWIKAAFGLSETPVYYDLEKSESNHSLALLYKDCKNQSEKVKRWSEYLVETIDEKDTKTRERVTRLGRMLDRMNALLEYIVGCIVYSTGAPEKWEKDMAKSYLQCIEGPIVLISIAVYDTLAEPYKNVLVHPMKENKENQAGVLIEVISEVTFLLGNPTVETNLKTFYYIPEHTKKMCDVTLNLISDAKELIVALGPSFGANIDTPMLEETVERLGLNELQEKNFATEDWAKLSSILSEVNNAITSLKGEHEEYISRKNPFDAPNRLIQQIKKAEKKIYEFGIFIEKTKNIFLIDHRIVLIKEIKDRLFTFSVSAEKINSCISQNDNLIFYELYVSQGIKQVEQAYKDFSQLLDRETVKKEQEERERKRRGERTRTRR
ncbi:hypothetical protein NECID01_1352, partial [Nematocida sp. AWRm77]